MSFLSFLNSSKHTTRLILDIGSGSVGGALVSLGANGHPQIEFSLRVDLPIKERVQSKYLISHTVNAVEKVTRKVREYTGHRISYVDIVFSSPWYSAETKSINVEEKDSFSITHKFIKNLIDKETDALKKAASDESVVMEEKISNIKLNGYKCDNPYSKNARRVEFCLFTSFVPKDFRDKIRYAVEHTAYPRKIEYHSFPMAAASAIKNIWHEEDSFVHIDIASEVTDVLFVNNGSISETFTFPLGTNHLVRSISKKQGVPNELAFSTLSLYTRGAAIASVSKDVELTLLPLKEEWLAYIDEVVKGGKNEGGITDKVYVTADSDVLPFWSQAISSRAHSIVMLSPENLNVFVNHKANVALDSFLTLESLYVYN